MAETAAEKKAREDKEAADAAKKAEETKNQGNSGAGEGSSSPPAPSTNESRAAAAGSSQSSEEDEEQASRGRRQLFKVAPGSSMVGTLPEGTVFDPSDTNKIFLGNTPEEIEASFNRLWSLGAIVPATAEEIDKYDLPMGDRSPMLATGTPIQNEAEKGARIISAQRLGERVEGTPGVSDTNRGGRGASPLGRNQ